MSSYQAPSIRRRSTLAPVLAALGLLLAAILTPSVTASAAPPVAATEIVVTSITTPSITVPDTAGAPASFIVNNEPFTVEVAFFDEGAPAPLSSNKDVNVRLSVADGPDALDEVRLVAKGATSATFEGVVLPTAANGVALEVASEPNKPRDAISGESAPFDVLKSFAAAAQGSALSSIGFGGGQGASCEATIEEPVCADLLLPLGSESSILLSLGVCDASVCPSGRSVVQALVDLEPGTYTREAPATLVMKCDKSECPGGAIHSYTLSVDDDSAGPMTVAEPCSTKGRIDLGLTYCVDYVQSTRDNAGDTHLFLLFLQDRRAAFP